VLWFTNWTQADRDSAFVNLAGAAYAPGNYLYTVDSHSGVIQLDAATGDVLAVFPNEGISTPSDVAADSAGNIYVADVGCRCILILGADGAWQSPIGEFSDGAPLSVTVAPGGLVYATDYGDPGARVRLFQGADEQTITLSADVTRQPLLTVGRAGRLLAVTGNSAALELQDSGFTQRFGLSGVTFAVNDVAVTADDSLVLATSTEGIVIVNLNGAVVNRLGRIVANFPRAGEVVNPTGVAVSPDGIIYWVDSDGQFGAVTAMSTDADAVRVGENTLALDMPVEGALSEAIPQQRWTYHAIAGQQATINAVDAVHDSGLDVAVRLLAPDGSEEAYNDDQQGTELYGPYDAQIPLHTFAASGAYSIVVERVQGVGTYRLGIIADRSFELNGDGVTRLGERLQDVFPTQRWAFSGRAGQVFTITMQADPASTLDPLLRLLAPGGGVVARNDDAADPVLGVNAQLVQVALPVDGTYVIEASRYEGEGAYSLVIVSTT
jgi:sugar lactone lactonase YvrE